MNDFTPLSEIELLRTHSAIIEELRRRGVVATRNNPIGDYTEWLVCRRFGFDKQANSQSGFDAVDQDGVRYQIKGRREEKPSVQFSSIRNLDQNTFDYVIAVVFHDDYSIRFAVLLPHDSVPSLARYQQHTNGHNLILTDQVIGSIGVTDITSFLRPSDDKPADISAIVRPSDLPTKPSADLVQPTRDNDSPHRWRTINVAHAADILTKSGYVCVPPDLDTRDVDILVAHGNKTPSTKIKCPGRLAIYKRCLAQDISLCFPDQRGTWYLIPHDVLVDIAGNSTPWTESISWRENGWYSSAKPSRRMLARIAQYALTVVP